MFFDYMFTPIQPSLAGSELKIGDHKRCLKGAGRGMTGRRGSPPSACKHSTRQRLEGSPRVSSAVEVKRDVNMLPLPFPHTRTGQDRTGRPHGSEATDRLLK